MYTPLTFGETRRKEHLIQQVHEVVFKGSITPFPTLAQYFS